MKALVEVDIYDDPDFCFAHNGQCDHFFKEDHYQTEEALCRYFINQWGGFRKLEYHKMQKTWVKCDKCKEVYKKSKELLRGDK